MVASQTANYRVSNVGTCLFLKLCGFVEAHRAEIRDVSETRLQLRLGGSWLERLLGSAPCEPLLDLEILIQSTDPESESSAEASVKIVIRDAHLIHRPDRFARAAQRVLHRLRSHLMV